MMKKSLIVTIIVCVLLCGNTCYAAAAGDTYPGTASDATYEEDDATVSVDGYDIPIIPGAPAEVYCNIANNMKKAEKLALREDPNSDLYILAHLINGEAGGATYVCDTTCYYVGSVVLNRVASDMFPDTIADVAFQSGQYACTWDGNYDKPMLERSWLIAEDLLENGSVLPEGVVWQAGFTQGSNVYDVIDGVYFCY
jgi:hypothetical protein